MPATTPDWITQTAPGDRRLLNQEQYWIQADGTILTLAEMTPDHLTNVVAFLSARATQLHMLAMADALLDLIAANAVGTTTADGLTHHLLGHSIATLDAATFVQTSPLVRAIHRELARRHASEA